MARVNLSIVAAVGLAIMVGQVRSARAEVKEGDRAAELSGAKDAGGHKVKLRSYRGKWMVVTFGASWCKPCGKELPAYERLARHHKDVVFLAVNIDSDVAKGKKFVKRSGLRVMHAAFDPSGSAAELYEPPTMPFDLRHRPQRDRAQAQRRLPLRRRRRALQVPDQGQ